MSKKHKRRFKGLYQGDYDKMKIRVTARDTHQNLKLDFEDSRFCMLHAIHALLDLGMRTDPDFYIGKICMTLYGSRAEPCVATTSENGLMPENDLMNYQTFIESLSQDEESHQHHIVESCINAKKPLDACSGCDLENSFGCEKCEICENYLCYTSEMADKYRKTDTLSDNNNATKLNKNSLYGYSPYGCPKRILDFGGNDDSIHSNQVLDDGERQDYISFQDPDDEPAGCKNCCGDCDNGLCKNHQGSDEKDISEEPNSTFNKDVVMEIIMQVNEHLSKINELISKLPSLNK